MSAPASPSIAEEGFSPRVALALVLTGVFAACAFLVLSAYAPDLRAGRQAGGNALSPSAVGYAGIVRLIRLTGQPVLVSRQPGLLKAWRGLMVVTPQSPLDAGALGGAVSDRLIVLPKWRTGEDQTHSGWVYAVDAAPVAAVAAIVQKPLGAMTVTRRKGQVQGLILSGSLDGFGPTGLPMGPVRDLQTISGPQLTPMLTDPDGKIVLAAYKGSRTFVLSDPDLLNTQGVADLRTARLAVLMLYNLHDEGAQVAFDVTLNGLGSAQSVLKLALQPPFLGATLSLAMTAVLIGLMGWSRFGPATKAGRAVALGKTALVENGAGMIRLARRETRTATRYVRLSQDRAAKALGAADLDEAAQTAFLDRWAERMGTQLRISRLMARAADVRTGRELTLLAQQTRQWRREMTREPE